MNWNKRKGLQYESLANKHLQKQGLKLLQQNFHSRFGEIDLVMLDGNTVCFIEVKYRKSLDFGGAASAISYSKRQKIIKTAQIFMSENRKLANRAMRFDALMLQHIDQDININWIQNAFYAE